MILTLDDMWYRWLQTQLPAGVLDGTIQVTPGGNIQNTYTVDSGYASAMLTAPDAATAIATTSSLTGLYKVSGYAMLGGSGTPVDADAANMALYVGVFRKATIIYPAAKNVPGNIFESVFRFNAQPAQIATIGAGTTNVNYYATVIATKIAD